MTHTRAVFLGLLAIAVCSGVAVYRGKGFDVRRIAAIALTGSAVLFVAAFEPGISAGMSGLLIADVLVLNANGAGLVSAVENSVVPGASTKPKTGPLGPAGPVGGSSTKSSPGILHGIDDFFHGTTSWQEAVGKWSSAKVKV